MSRYIEYEPIMEELEKEVKLADDWKTAHEIANVVKYAPSIDIVRCKECKYAHMTYGGECKYCDEWSLEDSLYLDGDFFCSYGERRSDE